MSTDYELMTHTNKKDGEKFQERDEIAGFKLKSSINTGGYRIQVIEKKLMLKFQLFPSLFLILFLKIINIIVI